MASFATIIHSTLEQNKYIFSSVNDFLEPILNKTGFQPVSRPVEQPIFKTVNKIAEEGKKRLNGVSLL